MVDMVDNMNMVDNMDMVNNVNIVDSISMMNMQKTFLQSKVLACRHFQIDKID